MKEYANHASNYRNVLIVPLWNWNRSAWNPSGNRGSRSNRTFMELKWWTHNCDNLLFHVLIVPLWNWNGTATCDSIGCCCVLIVPLWNWNLSNALLAEFLPEVLIVPLWNWNMADVLSRMFSFFCSNRTFMELKSKTRNKTETTMTVLIVPLWNWNRWSARPHREADWF